MQKIFRYQNKENYQFLLLSPFNDEQIQSYLQKKTVNPDFYWQQIKNIFELHDLAKRPVLLDLIIRYLPELITEMPENKPRIKATDLYQRCLEDELDRKSEDLTFKVPGKYRVEILQRISLIMYHTNTLSIDIQLDEIRLNLKKYFETKTEWEFEKHLNEFLSFTFLLREADYVFRISHKSFRDYLVASTLIKEIKNDNPIDFSKTKLSAEIINFIVELNPNKNHLLKWVLNSKKLSESNQWLGSNSANILLRIEKTALKIKIYRIAFYLK